MAEGLLAIAAYVPTLELNSRMDGIDLYLSSNKNILDGHINGFCNDLHLFILGFNIGMKLHLCLWWYSSNILDFISASVPSQMCV